MKHPLLWLFSLGYLLIFFLKLDSIPMIAMDEGWNAFYAYDEFLDNPYSLGTTIQYKLFFFYYILLAGWMKLFGISLFVVRSLNVVLGLAGLIGLYQLFKQITQNKLIITAGLLTFLMTNIVVVTFRWGRPEGMVLVLLVWALFFLVKAVQNNQPKQLFWGGLLLGLMVFTHPYSILVVLAIFLVLWRLPLTTLLSYRYLIYGGSIVVSIILIKGLIFDLDYLQTHFFDHISQRLIFSGSTNLLDSFIYFWQSYTLGVKRLYILIFEIGILIIGVFKYRKDALISNLSWMGLLTFMIGLVLLNPFRRRYMGIVMIFSVITSILMIARKKTVFKKFIITALMIYFSNNVLGNAYYIYKQIKNTSYAEITNQLQTKIPKGSKIMAPIQFWIALHPFYTITDIHDQIGADAILNKLNQVDYIVSSPFFLKNVSPTTGGDAIGYDLSKNSFHNTLIKVTQSHSWIKQKKIIATPYDTISIYKQERK